MEPQDEDKSEGDRFFDRLMRRPVTAAMAFLLVIVLGVVAYRRIPLMLMPQGLSDPEMEVEVPYPNASPEEVFQHVTKPVEDAVRQLSGVDSVDSRSMAGRSRVDVTFNADVDLDLAYAELKDRLERVRATFPEGVEEPVVWRWNSDLELPIFWIGTLFDPDVEDPFYLVEEVIQKRLQAVDGVAQVGIEGMVLESVRVFAIPEKLTAHGLSLYEVVDLLRRDNFTLPAGHIDDAGRQFLLRVDTSYHTLDEIRDYPLKRGIRLKDVADVRLARAYRDTISRVNGKRALTLTISKESDRNTVEVCRAVAGQLAELERDERLRGFEFRVYFDQSELIIGALDNLKSSLMFGALFSILVLFAFVRRVGVTALVAAAIPTSLLAALVAMYFTGFTFNIVTLAGITLATGMLVDNSIVVTENVLRLRSLGRTRMAAAASGAAEVALAIVLSTLTTVVVFAPLVFMADGQTTRALLTELAAPICYALLSSLFVALFLLPITMAHFLPRRAEALAAANTGAMDAPGPQTRLHRIYRALLAGAIAHRFAVVCGVVALVSLGQLAFANVDVKFDGGGEGGGRLRLSVDLPDRFTIEEASDVFAKYETFLLERQDELLVRDVSTRFDRREGRIFLWFADGTPPDHERDLAKRLEADLPKIAGVKLTFGFERGGEQGSVRIVLEGRDSVQLSRLAEEVVRELEQLPELQDVKPDGVDGTDELRISFDREEALRYGVSQEALLGVVSWGIGSQQLAPYRGGRREVPMLIEYEDPEVGDLVYLKGLDVPVSGGEITLGSLGTFEIEKSYGTIRRNDGIVSVGLSAQSYDDNGYRVARRVAETLDAFPFPEGVTWRDRGARSEYEESENEVFKGLLVGCIFVFLLMGMLFESAILPLAVLFTVPLALVGAAFALYLTGTPLDSTGLLSFILLAGVVVNNGIVLVDRIQQLRFAGIPRRTAILEGCTQRMRPVLMTALTTVFGLLPMAMPRLFAASSSGGGIDYQSLAVATLGGMIVSTLLTLLVVPMFYSLFDDLAILLRSMFVKPRPEDAVAPREEGVA
jgi:HAE1 family hydrophobic/amphiphilic exporter-1